MRKGSKGTGVELKGDSGERGSEGGQVQTKLQLREEMSGVEMPWDELQMVGGRKWPNFSEDDFEITPPDVDLVWVFYVFSLGYRLLNLKWCSLWNGSLIQYRELMGVGRGRQLMLRESHNYVNEFTEISFLRISCTWKAFWALHCTITTTYIFVIYNSIRNLYTHR